MNWSDLNQTLSAEAGKAQQAHDRSWQSLLASLTVSGALFGMAMVAFVFLKNSYPMIYQPSWSSHSSIPSLPSGLFAWLLPILRLPDETIILERGLDAFLLLRLLRTAVVLFGPLTVMLIPVLVSLDMTATSDGIRGATGLNRLSWSNLPPAQHGRYWGHVGACICVVGYLGLIMTRECALLTRLRQSRLLHPPHHSPAGVVLVTRIPPDWLSDGLLEDRLRHYYARFCRDGTTVHVVRDVQRVVNHMVHRDRLMDALEKAVTNWSEHHAGIREAAPRHGKACGPLSWLRRRPATVTEILRMAQNIQRLNEEIEDVLRNPARYPLLPCAFLHFPDPVTAHIMCQVVHDPAASGPAVHRIDAADRDQILWSNMGHPWRQQRWSRGAVTTMKILLAGGWAVPIALTGCLSQLPDLASTWPGIHDILLLPSALVTMVQGVLPPLALMFLMNVFPYLLVLLVGQQAYFTQTAAELSLQSYYFIFLYVQVFLVVSVSTALTAVVPAVLHDPQSITTILATNLPKASVYFFSYLLLFAFSHSAMQLTRVLEWVRRVPWPWIDRSPRTPWTQASTPPTAQLSLILPVFTNLMCLGIIFSVMAPLILACATLAFFLLWGLYRYLVIYVVTVPIDSCGMLYWRALQQLWVGVYTLELCQIGLFALAGARGPLIGMIVTLGGTVVFHYRTRTRIRPGVEYLPTSVDIATEKTPPAGRFGLAHSGLHPSRPVVWIPESDVSHLILQYIPVSTMGLAQNVDGTIVCQHGPPNDD